LDKSRRRKSNKKIEARKKKLPNKIFNKAGIDKTWTYISKKENDI